MATLLALTTDNVVDIFSYLSSYEGLSIRLVSKGCLYLGSLDPIWKYFLEVEWCAPQEDVMHAWERWKEMRNKYLNCGTLDNITKAHRAWSK